jgi:hypothetical protein
LPLALSSEIFSKSNQASRKLAVHYTAFEWPIRVPQCTMLLCLMNLKSFTMHRNS